VTIILLNFKNGTTIYIAFQMLKVMFAAMLAASSRFQALSISNSSKFDSLIVKRGSANV
jgi:hypothetical protein